MPTPLIRTAARRKPLTAKGSWASGAGLPAEAVLEVDGYIRKVAWSRASQAYHAGLEVEDLVQEGRAGALRAAGKFNAAAGVKFLTYAAWWIRAGITDALQRGLVSAPKGKGWPFVASLDQPICHPQTHQAEERSHLDLLLDPSQDPFEEAARAEEAARMARALPRLDPRTREVLARHVGLGGHEAQGLQAIAKDLGVSRQRVGQILQRGLDTLREAEAARRA
jgi:RNA polymerase sigma factor (sigma-70 family)